MKSSIRNIYNLEGVILRIGLISMGMLLFDVSFTVWLQGEPFRHPLGLSLILFANILGLALMVFGLIRRLPSQLTWLVLVSVLFVSLVRLYAFKVDFQPTGPVQTDTGMITGYAAQGLAHGQNPYAWNFADFLRVYRASPLYVTPHFDGTIQSKAAYPALTYWLFWGASHLGLSVSDLTFVCLILIHILLFITAPVIWRPLVLLPFVLFQEYTHFALVGNQDTILSLLLMGMLLVWTKPRWRAVIFGLACAFRQQAWFVAPFLLIYLWKSMDGTVIERRRSIAYFVGVSVGVFVLINLPFIIWDARAWWLGVFEHAYAPFNVYSHGLSTLSQYGWLPLPRQFYMALQFSTLVALMIVHWRHPRIIGQAFWVFPALFFWLYYRGLINYWVYWIPPLLVSLVNRSIPDNASERSLVQSSSWIGTMALTVPLLVIVVGWGVVLSHRQIPITVDYTLPLDVVFHDHLRVKEIKVSVTNESNTDFMPRFSVQRDPGIQALPWKIETGPEVLDPGQEGVYVVDAVVAHRSFPVERGGQIVVTDARGDYWRRAIATVPPDLSFADPNLIANPNFHFWVDGEDRPVSWSIRASDQVTSSFGLASVKGKQALVVRVGARPAKSETDAFATVRLVQSIAFPTELTVWAYPPLSSSDPLQSPYGLEFDDGEHILRILFGDVDKSRKVDGNVGYLFFSAPLKTWSQHTIRLQDLYELFGWQLPKPSLRRKYGLEYRMRQVQIGLISSSESLNVFGPIEQKQHLGTSDAFWSETLAHPDVYYIQRGNEYHRQRNYDLAQEAYRKALAYDPTNAESYFRLAEASFWCDEWTEALNAFKKSIAYGYPQPALAYRGMGWSYYNLGEFMQAEMAFQKATRMNPNLTDAYNGLGWVAVQQRRCDDAIEYFQKALDLEPNFPDPRRGMEACEP
jgi:uncharacterized membrane protein